MAYTGGELNSLNGKYGVSAPYKSVPVMKLIKEHRPKSKDALYQLIEYHFKNNCKCGVKSKGTIEDFGKNLFEAQIKEWGKHKYTLKECIQWEYDLFIIQSLKGTKIENNAKQLLQNKLSEYSIKEAEGFVDEELRVDLIILRNEKEICGVQVKPLTFKYMRDGIIAFNKIANAKWGKTVFYLFYDKNEKFTNLDNIIIEINQLT